MSTQLAAQNIELIQGFDSNQLDSKPDCIVVGNVMRRGMPVIETLLNQGLPFLSGPEFLSRYVLKGKQVVAVAGTHGKTTTSSMLAWILEFAGLHPGFLIGGVPNNFGMSARLGRGNYFVVEADEYDTAFFDKRSKFVHYYPRTLIINNIEFDHADIFSDLTAIQQQFHHLVRTVPGTGHLICPLDDSAVETVLKMGCWTPVDYFSESNPKGWHVGKVTVDSFEVRFNETNYGSVQWTLLGKHNQLNALAAIAAVEKLGVPPAIAIEALCHFEGVKRRMEMKGIKNTITVYDDFAHHPTAIATTLSGLRQKVGGEARIVAVVDIRSNTMRGGHHQEPLALACQDADEVYFFKTPETSWDVDKIWLSIGKSGGVFTTLESLLKALTDAVLAHDQVVFMSNGGFGGIHDHFLQSL